jgi:hypothetical protein
MANEFIAAANDVLKVFGELQGDGFTLPDWMPPLEGIWSVGEVKGATEKLLVEQAFWAQFDHQPDSNHYSSRLRECLKRF